MPQKTISPAAINALKEALATVYWYKRDLRTFLAQSLRDERLMSLLDWNDLKRNIVSQLVDRLAARQDKYQNELLGLMADVCCIKDFCHLERLDDGKEKAKAARAAVTALALQCRPHQELEDQRARAEAARKAAIDRAAIGRGVSENLMVLRCRFYELATMDNPQQRGFALERFIRELFGLFDLDPRSSFRITGEQIDGAFTFDSTDYLFEGKWQKEPVGVEDLDAFAAKVGRRLENTL